VTDDGLAFKALADPTRRLLLDRLFERDGRTLTELESAFEMTRFGVMKHLRQLEDAGLVVTRKSGREKLHFLNPVPIRLIHDRWIDKYTERQVSALADLKTTLEEKGMTASTETETTTTQVYRVYIKATPQAIWDAITKPEWTARYGYTGLADYDLRPGGAYRVRATEPFKAAGVAQGYEIPDVIADGEVLEADPPHRLVTTFRLLMDPATASEKFTRITHEISEGPNGVCALTLTHELEGAPNLAAIVAGTLWGEAGGGHAWVLSDLKTLLETGSSFAS
jgi:DNA-binding transcriptional ArsR family regulator